jgi:hypothetical protein
MGTKNIHSNKPRLVGGIVSDMLKGWNRSTELAVDLKTILRSDRTMRTGKEYQGVLSRDQDACIEDFRCRDAHYTFVETEPWTEKRNPRVFRGRYITITRRENGKLRLNFRQLPANMSVERYAFQVFLELHKGLKGLVKK